jgi:hypothetical protein
VFENQRVVRAVLGDESSPFVDSSLEYALVRGTGEAEVVHVHGIVTAGDELLEGRCQQHFVEQPPHRESKRSRRSISLRMRSTARSLTVMRASTSSGGVA